MEKFEKKILEEAIIEIEKAKTIDDGHVGFALINLYKLKELNKNN